MRQNIAMKKTTQICIGHSYHKTCSPINQHGSLICTFCSDSS